MNVAAPPGLRAFAAVVLSLLFSAASFAFDVPAPIWNGTYGTRDVANAKCPMYCMSAKGQWSGRWTCKDFQCACVCNPGGPQPTLACVNDYVRQQKPFNVANCRTLADVAVCCGPEYTLKGDCARKANAQECNCYNCATPK